MKTHFFALFLIPIFLTTLPINALNASIDVESAKAEAKIFLLEKHALAMQHGTQGIQLCTEKKFEEAIEVLDTAILLNPEQASFYSIRSTAFIGVAKFEKSLDDINKAILMDPKNAGFYNIRATVNLLLGEIQKSIQDLITSAKLGDISAQEKLKALDISCE
ncbi:MAG TPA: hypothetical protein VLG44_04140 [Chlamydiales bacterium]|nr:hypothetical protein [Chlamydiales bacterium]